MKFAVVIGIVCSVAWAIGPSFAGEQPAVLAELTPFEQQAVAGLERARAGDADALLALAVVASGNRRDQATFEKYRVRVHAFVAEVKPLLEAAPSPRARADRLHREMHRTFLSVGKAKAPPGPSLAPKTEGKPPNGYRADQSQLTELFETGHYNCASSALLYLLLARYFDLQGWAMSVPGHVFTELELPGGERVEVETTAALGGFGVTHDAKFYAESAEFLKVRNLPAMTLEDYRKRERLTPIEFVGRSMVLQHTGADRMDALNRDRLQELASVTDPTIRLLALGRLTRFVNAGNSGLGTDPAAAGRLLDRAWADLVGIERRWPNDEEISRMFSSARVWRAGVLRHRQQHNEATQILEAVLATTQGRPDAWKPVVRSALWGLYTTAKHHADAGRFEVATQLVERSATRFRQEAQARAWAQSIYTQWTQSHIKAERWKEALEIHHRGQSWMPADDPTARVESERLAANLYVQLSQQAEVSEQWDTALAHAQSAMDASTHAEDQAMARRVRASVFLAWSQAQIGRAEWTQGVATLQRGLEATTDGTDADRLRHAKARAYLVWGNHQYRAEQWPEAVKLYRTALSIPNQADVSDHARQNLVNVYVAWGSEQAAAKQWERAFELLDQGFALDPAEPDRVALRNVAAHAHWSRAVDLVAAEQYAKGIETYKRALEMCDDPTKRSQLGANVVSVYLNWAESRRAAGAGAEARSILARCAADRPDAAACRVGSGP